MNNRLLSDATPAGILDRIEWDYHLVPIHAGNAINVIRELHHDLFPLNDRRIVNVCGNQEALHPQIPAIRITFRNERRFREHGTTLKPGKNAQYGKPTESRFGTSTPKVRKGPHSNN